MSFSDYLDNLLVAGQPHFRNIFSLAPSWLQTLFEQQVGSFCQATILGLHTEHTIPPNDFHTRFSCFKLAFSKAVGLSIVGASACVKLPQLIRLLVSQSPLGVSTLSTALEAISYTLTALYHTLNSFSFSTYGETILVAIQDIIITLTLLLLRGHKFLSIIWIVFIILLARAFFWPFSFLNSPSNLSWLQVSSAALSLISKIPQIWTIQRHRCTGQLSAFAILMYLLGSASRIFTTLNEVNDPLVLATCTSGFVLNLILALQMLHYPSTLQPKHHRHQSTRSRKPKHPRAKPSPASPTPPNLTTARKRKPRV